MSDETFVQHLMARHEDEVIAELDLEGALRCGTLAVLDAYRRFHERIHELATPDQYDHEHDYPTPV
jgi:hypothetical protein